MKVSAKASNIPQREPSKRTKKPSAAALSAPPVRSRRTAAVKNASAEQLPSPETQKKRGRPSLKKLAVEEIKPVEEPTVEEPIADKPTQKKRGRKPKELLAKEEVPKKKATETKANPNASTKKKNTQKQNNAVAVQETNNNVSTPSKVINQTRSESKDVSINSEENEESGSMADSSPKSRKYRCDICDKNFLGSNDLRKHLRIHR